MKRRRLIRAFAASAAVVAVGGGAAWAQPSAPPFSTPNTDACPNRLAPAPAIDASEAPLPGMPPPTPLPVPAVPVGGNALGRCGVITAAAAPPLPADISAQAWVLSDVDTGTVVAAKDPHGRYRPASTIKVLLAIVALRTLDLDHIVIGTRGDADADGTRVGIGPGGRYSNRQLMQALVMCSGNDAAHAIAMQLGGMDAAVAKMNETAKALGALDTRAASPSGLDGPGMSTSAYDLSLIFREALTIPLFAELIHTEHADFPGYPANPQIPDDKDHPGFPIYNDNRLLANYPGALGGKTGYTDDARQTFVAGAARDGYRLAITLLHADVLPIRPWEQAARLLDYGFAVRRTGIPPVGELVAPHREPSQPSSPGDSVGLATPPADSAHRSPDSDQKIATALVIGGGAVILGLLLAAGLLRRRPRRH
ncbi:MAG: D-alanyl-D-alanine carboxypeptidase [Mycobacteriaceae bacterium]|nr:D-alanyl-D-alanine carboxypeptidase [Mycobacteriaceae bacterium]